ncbi:membrane dipeptidase [Intrasporangium sp.]|uniref:membrane dipeptidase n=1 Tax=Intrasporangium sp. TaxID=1925024 RepID=UPI00293B465E|nr:membrane dipeptidase [Intrasporangium sp.]MDV3221702.1 dipeptidase [Intrasporangium sp.]
MRLKGIPRPLLGVLLAAALGLAGLGVPAAAPATAQPLSASASQSEVATAETASVDNLTPSPSPVVGFADLHNHQFANLGFGGLLLWGEPFHEQGIEYALPWSDFTPAAEGEVVQPDGSPLDRIACGGIGLYSHCPPTCPPGTGPGTDEWCWGVAVHGAGGLYDLLQMVLNGGIGHAVGGYPEFDGWPRWNTATGQQAYVDWVERSWHGGQRLMSMLAVNNESLCSLVNRRAAFGCDDMSAVDRQLQGARNLERYVDLRDDNELNGSGWYRIATSSAEARQIIASGKLAVVLGIEVPSLFDCKPNAAACTEAHVRERLDHYYELGVRQVLPVHNADNAFGGTALYNEIFAANNRIITGEWWNIENCPPSTGIDFHAGLTDDPLFQYFAVRLAGETPPPVPEGSSCNAKGLTPLGESLIQMLMDKKMIIDLDHLSAKSLDRALDLLEERGYPAAVMSHSGFHGAALPGGGGNHEGNKSDLQLERLRALGGTVAAILHQGGRSDVRTYVRPDGSTPVPFTCGESSQAWAQAYLYAVEKMQDRAVAIGSDFNGFAGMPAPRFGDEACKGDMASGYVASPGVTYPFTAHGTGAILDRQVIGENVFDYNVDGLSNNGMLPDFIEDLKRIGLTDADLAPLFGSAEQVVRMWELAEDTTAPTVTCSPPDGAWHAGNVTVECTATDDVAGLASQADAAFSLSTSVAVGVETDDAKTGTRTVCDVRANCVTAGPFGGHKVDRRGPQIDLVAPAVTTYTIGEPLTASYSCSDGGSGVAECAGPQPDGGEVPTDAVGTFQFTVSATDQVGNRSTSMSDYRVSYGVCPLYDTDKAKPAGSVVPLAVMLCDSQGGNVSGPDITVTALDLVRVSDETTAPVEDAGNANPDSGFRYSSGLGVGGGYIYNLSTKGKPSGTWALRFTATGDPNVHRVLFQLK